MENRGLGRSFKYAFAGIFYVILTQRNMKIHVTAALIAILACFLLGVSRLEWAIIVLTIFMVLVAETINTAIEKTIDMFTMEYHPLAKKAKNMAAGAVLFTAINALIIAGIIFGPYILE